MNSKGGEMINPKSQISNSKQIPISNVQNSKQGSFGHCLLFGIWCLVIGISISGCAVIKETAKGISGISIKALEEARKDAIIKPLNYDYFSCYTKTLDILRQIGAYIYMQDIKKHMIAIYVSEQDTTAVGLFFKEIDATHTQIEVSSPSTSAKEFISSKIFSVLNPE